LLSEVLRLIFISTAGSFLILEPASATQLWEAAERMTGVRGGTGGPSSDLTGKSGSRADRELGPML
jgi:hypothetical protein